MADYEVKVAPILEVDMDKLKADVRNLSSMINKEATGKIRFEADTSVAKKQLQELTTNNQIVQVGAKVDARSIAEVEAEIRQRLKKIEKLSDVAGDLDVSGNNRTVADFKKQIQALVEIRLEYEKLARIQTEYTDVFVNQQKTLEREDRFLANQLRNLKDFRQSSAEEVQEVVDVFRKIHKIDTELPPIDFLLNIDESQALDLVKEVLSGLRQMDTAVGVDVNVAEESIRKVETTIADVQKQLNEISEVVIPLVVSRDMQSPGVQRAKELGHDVNNLDQARYAQDVIEAYNKRLLLIEEAVRSTQRLHEVSQEAVNDNQELLAKLSGVVTQLEAHMLRASSQVEHYQTQLENLTSAEVQVVPEESAAESVFAAIESKIQELHTLHDKISKAKREMGNALVIDDVQKQAHHDPQLIEDLRRKYENNGFFVADTAEQFEAFMQQKRQAVIDFNDAIDTVYQSILELGSNSNNILAAIDFISQAMDKGSESVSDFASSQQRLTEEIIENLKTIIEAYKNFTIPDPHAGKSTKAFKAAVHENLARKDLSGKWQIKDDETIGRNVLQKLEQQKSLLAQAQKLAQEYHDTLDGSDSQLGKPILNFLDSIQDRLQTNAEAADMLRKKLQIDDNAVAAGMNKHIGEQIREVQSRTNPFKYASDGWFETEQTNLTQLIKLSEQYAETLTKLNSTGFLPENKITNIEILKRDLSALAQEQERIQATRTVPAVDVNDTVLAIQDPVPITGELKIDNEQVREAFESLDKAIKENKAISQEILTLTTDNFQQKHDAIVAVQGALEKLISLYHELQEASTGGVGLSDADLATLANLLDQLKDVKVDLASLQNQFAEIQQSLQGAKEAIVSKVEEINAVLSNIGNVDITDASIKSITNEIINAINELSNLPVSDHKLQLESYEKANELLQQLISLHSEYSKQTTGEIDFSVMARNVEDVKSSLRVFEEEKRAAQELTQAWDGHPGTMRDAAGAELAKLDASQRLAAALEEEKRAVTNLGDAVERAETSGSSRSPSTPSLTPVAEADLSKVSFDTRNIDPEDLQRQLQSVFEDALSRQEDFLTAKVRLTVDDDNEVTRATVTFKDNLGRVIEQIYGLVAVTKDEANAAAQETMSTVDGVAEEAEKRFQHLRTTISANFGEDNRFNETHHQELALQQIQTLENQAKGLGIVFDELRTSAENIVDVSSLQEFSNKMTLMKEQIRTAKADLQGMNKLDTVSAMQRQIENFSTKISTLVEKINRLAQTGFSDVPTVTSDFNALNTAVSDVTNQFADFQATQDSLGANEKIAAFNKLITSMNAAENQLKTLTQQQQTHKAAVSDFIKTIREEGQARRQLAQLGTGTETNEARNNLNQQLEALQAKLRTYDNLQVSVLELTRIEAARHRAEAMADPSRGRRVDVQPLSTAQLASMQSVVNELQRSFSGINFSINTEATEDSLNRVHGVIESLSDALADVNSNNGFEGQADAVLQYEANLKLAKQSLRELKNYEGDARGITRLQEQIEQLEGRLNRMGINWSAFRTDPEMELAWNRLREEIDSVRNALHQAQEAGNTPHYAALNKEFQALTQRVRTFSAEVQGAGRAKMAFGDAIFATSKKLGAYLVSMFSFYRVISMFRDAVRYIHEIDRAMTALRRVTDETARTYNAFLSEAYTRAMRLGTSVNQIINATADFARLGYSLSEATLLGDAAAVYFNVGNVGNERLPIEDAVQSIISTMKANKNAFYAQKCA